MYLIWCLLLEKEILMRNTLFEVPAVHTKKMVISEEKMFFAAHTEEEEVSVTGTRQIWIWGSTGRASDGFLSLFLSNLCLCRYLCLLVNLSSFHFTVVCFNSYFTILCKLQCHLQYGIPGTKMYIFLKSLRYKRKLLPKRKFMLLFPKRLNLHPKVLVIYSKFKLL